MIRLMQGYALPSVRPPSLEDKDVNVFIRNGDFNPQKFKDYRREVEQPRLLLATALSGQP